MIVIHPRQWDAMQELTGFNDAADLDHFVELTEMVLEPDYILGRI